MGLIPMHRAARLLALVALVVSLFSCGAPKAPPGPAPVPPRALHRRAGAAKVPTILVLMPNAPQAHNVWDGLASELSSDFDVLAEYVEKDTPLEVLSAAVQKAKPSCLVLMDNPTLRLYHHYQQKQPAGTAFPPSVVVMASFLDQSYRTIQNATGIAYEVPGVIQFSRLRSILSRPVRRIGVIYRTPFHEFIAHEGRLALREQFELVPVQVARDPRESEIAGALKRLLEKEKVDSLWILNDNGLLTPRLVTSVWNPILAREDQIPVVVGVRALVNQEHRVGSFAMLPDHQALGAQAANLVFDLAENQWKMDARSIQAPISIKTVVDIKQARQYFGLQAKALERIDETIE